MKQNSATLGFLPFEALTEYQERGGLLGAKTADGALAGYLLYSIHHTYFRIVHLCVSEHHRGQKIATSLLAHLRNSATTQRLIKLHCRRDYAASAMWPVLGFVPLDEKVGRSAAGHPLTLWCLTLAQDRQMELFQALTLDEHCNVVVDSQIFFDFHEPKSRKTLPSKSLLSDFLIDTLNLWATDELLVEIDRKKNSEQREESRRRAYAFPQIAHNPVVADHFETILRNILPSRTSSQLSDIRHLAKTAASDSTTFVTRDGHLLGRAEEICNATNITVLSPTQLIVGLYDTSAQSGDQVDRVTGVDISWRPFTSSDLVHFPTSLFVDPKEKHAPFLENLNAFVSQPNKYQCTILQRGENIIAFRVLTTEGDTCITVPLAGVARICDRELVERHLVSDTIARAIRRYRNVVRFENDGTSRFIAASLISMGFIKQENTYYRFTFPCSMTRRKALAQVSEATRGLGQVFRSMTDLELERHCSPLAIGETRPSVLVPIRPGYAMSLFDQLQSGQDLFGGNTNVLFRWENIYYRKATHRRIIKAPGRIFWYVSSPRSSIVATSHLDEVRIDTPKKLFHAFEKFGILDWSAIHNMCGGDISQHLMAIKFSHTFLFRRTISLKELLAVYSEHGKRPVLQSPSCIPMPIVNALIDRGYEVQS